MSDKNAAESGRVSDTLRSKAHIDMGNSKNKNTYFTMLRMFNHAHVFVQLVIISVFAAS